MVVEALLLVGFLVVVVAFLVVLGVLVAVAAMVVVEAFVLVDVKERRAVHRTVLLCCRRGNCRGS